MIVFDLECRDGAHRFEGWFNSSDDFARQQLAGLLMCPVCGSAQVGKSVMAPNLARKGNQMPAAVARSSDARPEAPDIAAPELPVPPTTIANAPPPPLSPEAIAMFRAVAAAQSEALKSSRWVGDGFAENARAMHYGEQDHELIHGQTTPDEAEQLREEGIEITPILFPVAPPGAAN